MMGREGKKQDVPLNKFASFSHDLNQFYSRFDNSAAIIILMIMITSTYSLTPLITP